MTDLNSLTQYFREQEEEEERLQRGICANVINEINHFIEPVFQIREGLRSKTRESWLPDLTK